MNDIKFRRSVEAKWMANTSPLKDLVIKLLRAKENAKIEVEKVNLKDIENVGDNQENKMISEKRSYANIVSRSWNPQVTSFSLKKKGNVVNNELGIYEIKNVKADGNCLFRCFSQHLYNTEERHYEIHSQIVQYTINNWVKVKDTLCSTCVEDEGTIYDNAESYK